MTEPWPTQPTRVRNILLVDDDVAFTDLLKKLLLARHPGSWDVYSADYYLPALACLKEHALDLVVLDILMPVMDGVELLQQIKQTHPELPVVMLTALATPEIRDQCMQHGAALFFDKAEVADKLEKICVALEGLTAAPRKEVLVESPSVDSAPPQTGTAAAQPSSPVPHPQPAAPEAHPAAGQQVEEIVLPAEGGQILYEWQSPQANQRIQLMEHFVKLSGTLAKILLLRRPDRLEVETGDHRVIMLFPAERKAYVQARLPTGTKKKMNPVIDAWFAKTAPHPAVIACGFRGSDRSVQVKSFHEELPEAHISQALGELTEALYTLQRNQTPATRLRWTFEVGQILCVTGAGGVMAMLLIKNGLADDSGIEQLLTGPPLATA